MSERLLRVGLVAIAALAGVLVGRLLAPEAAPAPPLEAPAAHSAAPTCSYTPEELTIACLPYMRRTATSLEDAQTKVNALELRIREKETLIEVLEERRAVGGAKATGDLEEARSQLARLEAELGEAIDEKARLLVTLARTQDELQGSRIALARSEAQVIEAREDAISQGWTSFVQEAQLRICQSGNPDRLGQCRDIVIEVITPLRQRYVDCARSGSATPELRRAARPDDMPPRVSAPLDVERDPLTRGWYVVFCDPELPEAGATPGG